MNGPSHTREPREGVLAPAELADLADLLGPRGTSPPASSDPAALAATQERLDADTGLRARIFSAPTRVRMVAAFAMAVLWPSLVLLTNTRADLSVLPGGRMTVDLALLVGPAAALILLAMRPLHRPATSRVTAIVGVMAAVAAVAIIAALPAAHALHPASLEGVGADLGRRAVGCFGYGTVFALLYFAGLALLHRGPRRLGGMVAAGGAGLIGSVALYLHCPITHPLHLWIGHVTVLAPFVVYALVVRRP